MQQNLKRVEEHTFATLDSKPVLKWAGGKTQLLPILNKHYPTELKNGDIETYIEPFIGGGAVFFDIANKFKLKSAFLFDINIELIILYNALKENVDLVISDLARLQSKYLDLPNEEDRKKLFYEIRENYNNAREASYGAAKASSYIPARAAMTIFLNRTCFNGLFRVNSRGEFNVPHGRYKNPTILFEEKLNAASQALQIATIKTADFSEVEKHISGKTFVYYDPPYRPVNKTSSFNSYAKEAFDDGEQVRLANTYKKMHSQNVYQLLSNSDPTNYIEDPFFDELYCDFEILRVDATRRINSNANNRGELKEILVRNY